MALECGCCFMKVSSFKGLGNMCQTMVDAFSADSLLCQGSKPGDLKFRLLGFNFTRVFGSLTRSCYRPNALPFSNFLIPSPSGPLWAKRPLNCGHSGNWKITVRRSLCSFEDPLRFLEDLLLRSDSSQILENILCERRFNEHLKSRIMNYVISRKLKK